MSLLEEILVENPVIIAVRNDSDLNEAVRSAAKVVFVLYGGIMNIKDICEKLKKSDKLIFVHIDMLEGLKGDNAGLEFIKRFAAPQGIITTKATNIKHAKHLGFSTIQRIFIIDSLSLESGIKNVKEVMPDAVEVMPGVASNIISTIQKEIPIPIIAGGLIKDKKDIMEALSSGAIAISTSNSGLWNL